LLAALHIKRVMDILQRAIVGPKIEIIVEGTLGRKVLGHIAPLAPRAQYVHDPIHDLAHIGLTLAAAVFGWGNERLDVRPLLVCQITRITQLVTIVFRAVCKRPPWRPLLESGRLP